MLGTGGDGIVGAQPATPLEPADAGIGHDLAQQQVLARPLDPATPALVAGDVDHRRKGPVDAGRRRLDRRGARGTLCQIGVEAARLGQRHGEYRAEAVDDVGGEQQRHLQPLLAHRDQLHPPRHLRAIAVEHAGQLAGAHLRQLFVERRGRADRVQRVRRAPGPGGGHQRQLSRLFLDRHLTQQRLGGSGEAIARLRQQRPRRRRAPRGHGARAHHQRPPRNPDIFHAIPSVSVAQLSCRACCFESVVDARCRFL